MGESELVVGRERPHRATAESLTDDVGGAPEVLPLLGHVTD
jgi:hypothetical protein